MAEFAVKSALIVVTLPRCYSLAAALSSALASALAAHIKLLPALNWFRQYRLNRKTKI